MKMIHSSYTKQIILLLGVLLFHQLASAQAISRKVLSTMGGAYQDSNFQVTYTVGETIISTIITTNNIVTEGFQQPPCFNDSSAFSATAIDEYNWNGNSYSLTGNYTHTYINRTGCDSVVTLHLVVYHTTITMTLQNVNQISPSIFEYDIILTNTGNTSLALKGYSCGINHAIGMRGTGTISHTFVSRDPSLSLIPTVSPGYTPSNNHLRFIAANAATGNEVILLPGVSKRIATMRVTNSIPFPIDFVPDFTLQNLTAIGKTQCIATCIVTPPGTSNIINGIGNISAAGTIQGLTGIVNTPCLYLHPSSNFISTVSQTFPTTCYEQQNGSAIISLSGNGSSNSNGTYLLDGGSGNSYSTNPFTVNNLSSGNHTITVNTNYGCSNSNTLNISQPALITTSSSITACDQFTWEGTEYTSNTLAIHTYTSSNGCDSIHNLHLTINHSNSGSSSIIACNNYTWNGITYNSSGTYNQPFLNINGCDSIHTLNLTILTSSASLTTAGGCNSYNWNGTTYNATGTYVQNYLNELGCDSIASLVLTINNVHIVQTDTTLCTGSSINLQSSGQQGITNGIVQNYTATFLNGWQHAFNTIVGVNYKLEVSGLYTIWTVPNDIDPAYRLPPNFQPLNPTCSTLLTQSGSWYINEFCGLRPSPDVYNPSHTYTYFFTANTPQTTLGFYDNCCYGDNSGQLTFTLSENLGSASYSWSTGEATPSINLTPNQTNTYFLTSSIDSISCLDSVQITISNPSIDAGSNRIICQGDSIVLNATGTNTYSWSNGINNGQSFVPLNSQTYTVTGTNSLGCTATSSLNVIVNPTPSPNISTTGATTFCNGNSVILNTNNTIGSSFEWYNNSTLINGENTNSLLVNQSGNYAVKEITSNGCSTLSAVQAISVNSCDVNLHLSLFYQGYYIGSSSMTPTLLNEGVSADTSVTDTILVELHSPLPPYGLILSKNAILHTNGIATSSFNYVNGNYYLADSYYVAIRHRNGITTWSANPIQFNSNNIFYNFTESSSQAMGDNMNEVEPGIWAFYTGDLNADDNIDLIDNPYIEQDINNFNYGYYPTDLNGDGNVDLVDVPILESNIYSFIFSVQPTWYGTLPSVATNSISSISGSSAICTSNVISDGGTTIIERGICWSINHNPTLNDSHFYNGIGLGSYPCPLYSLMPSTTYFVRAYVTTSNGTVYGNELNFVSANIPLTIGLTYQGGKVAYIFQPGDNGYISGEQHGLIASPSDLGFAEWGCYNSIINGADGTTIGSGHQNTLDIVNGCSSQSIAAQLCNDLVLNGYNDWFLPSRDELYKLYLNKASIGGFNLNYYWTSTEADIAHAWELNFTDGLFYTYNKNGTPLIRAIRAF